MNRYDKLAKNTVIFALGTIGSKLLVFLLLPLYTRVLTTSDYSFSELIVSSSNLITPFVILAINEGVIRFSMDKQIDKKQVLSIGLATVLAGFGVFLLFSPLLYQIDLVDEYLWLIYCYVFMAALRLVSAQFVRGIGYIRLFVVDGVLTTIMTILFNLLFLLGFKWGAIGYVLSIVAANVVSVIFLWSMGQLWKYVDFRRINPMVMENMYRYSIPLIPSTVFWWVTNVSDRYIVTYFQGAAANGVYSMAYKIPTLMTLVSGIFYQAWQISAIEEYGSPKAALAFYSQVLNHYASLLCCAASGLIMLCVPITSILVSDAFHLSWQYVPYLVIAEIFSTLVTFLGTFYMVIRKSGTVLLAIGIGGVSNVLMNLWLVPHHGAMGAALATMLAYILAFVVRYVDVRRLMPIKMNLVRLVLSFVVVLLQSMALINGYPYTVVTQIGCCLLVIGINITAVISILSAVWEKLTGKKGFKGVK